MPRHLGVKYKGVDVLQDPGLRQGIKDFSDWPTVPQLYVKGEFVGGCDIVREMFQSGELQQVLDEKGVSGRRQQPDGVLASMPETLLARFKVSSSGRELVEPLGELLHHHRYLAGDGSLAGAQFPSHRAGLSLQLAPRRYDGGAGHRCGHGALGRLLVSPVFGLLFQKVGWLYGLVKLAGAAYLIFVGLQMIFSARRPTAGGGSLPLSDGRAFRRGLLTDLSNPKAAAFFTSLFAVAVPPTAPLWFDA